MVVVVVVVIVLIVATVHMGPIQVRYTKLILASANHYRIVRMYCNQIGHLRNFVIGHALVESNWIN